MMLAAKGVVTTEAGVAPWQARMPCKSWSLATAGEALGCLVRQQRSARVKVLNARGCWRGRSSSVFDGEVE